MDGIGRAWFGRMYLPPRDAMLQSAKAVMGAAGDRSGHPRGISFGEYREQVYAAFSSGAPHLAPTAGCGGPSLSSASSASVITSLLPVTGRSLQDSGSCAKGQVYCWESCVVASTLALPCAVDSMICANPSGRVWDPTTHCDSCTVQCPPRSPPNPAPRSAPKLSPALRSPPPAKKPPPVAAKPPPAKPPPVKPPPPVKRPPPKTG